MKKDDKKTTTKDFGSHAKDTGSTSVQIALLTKKITDLTDHLKTHKKDKHSRRGLVGMVGKRRKLLRYLRNTNSSKYSEVTKSLGLKK